MPGTVSHPDAPLKVAHLTTVDLSLRFLVLAQLRAVRERGGEAIGISAPGPWVAELEREGIRHVALGSSTRSFDPVKDARAAGELARVLRRERPTVLHTHNPKPGLYGRVVGRMARVPIVVNTVHGLYATDDDPWAKRSVVYSLEAVAARCSDAELYQNPEDLELATRLRITRHASFLGNGVDLDRFDPARFTFDDRRKLRAELGVEEGRVLLGAVGRLVAEKGYVELFEAFTRLPPGSAALVVAGDVDPDKADALPAAVMQRARDAGVQFLGHRDDVDALYAALDLFVLPSHREGFPRAAMEAAASGVPIVTTDVRGCREVVVDGVNGLLVPVGDTDALARALGALVDDAERRARMGVAARARALEHFDERVVVTRVLDAYRAVAARKGIAIRALA